MNIENNKVVSFHYTVSEVGGTTVESSKDSGKPLYVLYGAGNIIPGLEKALEGKAAGDRVEAIVEPSEAYGERDESLIQRVPKKRFGNAKLTPGQTVMVQTQQGPRPLTVIKVGMSVVDVDLNHPMAGKTLRFEVEILDVRDATEEEIEHRHAHPPGAEHH